MVLHIFDESIPKNNSISRTVIKIEPSSSSSPITLKECISTLEKNYSAFKSSSILQIKSDHSKKGFLLFFEKNESLENDLLNAIQAKKTLPFKLSIPSLAVFTAQISNIFEKTFSNLIISLQLFLI
jgi:hypothetical protein